MHTGTPHRVVLAILAVLAPTAVARATTYATNACESFTPATELVARFDALPADQRAEWARSLRRAVMCDPELARSVPELSRIVPQLGDSERSRVACFFGFDDTEHVMDPILVPLTRDSNTSIRACAVRGVLQSNPARIPLGVAALGDPAPEVRESAAQALGTLAHDHEEARAALASAVADSRPDVRAAALEVLASTPVDGVDEQQLVELLSHSDARVRVNAAAALAGTKKSIDQALPVLATALAGTDPELQRRAAYAIGQLGPKGASAAPALVEAMARADRQHAQTFASALSQLGASASAVAPTLVKLLADPERAPAALAALGSVAKDLTPAIPGLVDLLRHGSPEVQSTVLDVLTKAGPAAAPAIDELVRLATTEVPVASSHESDEFEAESYRQRALRAEALRVLAAIGPKAKDALPRIEKLLASDDPRLVEVASETYTKLGGDPKKLTARWVKDLESSDPARRKSALGLLAQGGGDDRKAALPGVRRLLHDADPEVREAAAHALWAIDHDPDEIVSVATEMAKDSDPKVRAGAIRVVSRAAPSVLIRSKSWLTGLLDDPDADVRRQAIGTLYELRGAAAEAVPRLVQMLGSEDRDVFTQVLMALQMMGPAAAPALPALEELKGKAPRYQQEMIARTIDAIRATGATGGGAAAGSPDAELAKAEELAGKGDVAGAEAAYQRAIDGFHAKDEKAQEARAHDALAVFLDSHGKKERVREHLDKAAELSRAIDDKPGELSVMLQLAALDREEGRPDEARTTVEKARELAKGVSNPDVEGAALLQLAGIAIDTGARDEARQYLLDAQQLFRRSGNGLGEGFAMMSLGGLELLRSRFDPARAAFDTARQLFQQADDPLREGLALYLWTNLDVALGNWDDAERRIGAARGLFEKVHEPRFEAKAWSMQASILTQRGGRAADARKAAQRALTIARATPDDDGIAHALVGLAELDRLEGKTRDAIDQLASSREAAVRAHQDLTAALIDAGLAQLDFRLAEVAHAAQSWASADQTAKRLRSAELGFFLGIVAAEREVALGNTTTAASALDRAQGHAAELTSEVRQAEVDTRRAMVAWRRGAVDDARAGLLAARPVQQRFHRTGEEIEILRAIADLELQAGKLGAAKDAATRALELARARQSPEQEADAASTLALVERATGGYTAARDGLANARAFYERAEHYRALGRIDIEHGRLETRLGRAKEAQAAFDSARTTCALFPIPECEADALVGSASLKLAAGRPDGLTADLGRAAMLYAQVESAAGAAWTELRLGDVDRIAGNSAEARRHYDAALKRFEAIAAPAGKAEARLGLGRIELASAHSEEARAAFEAARKLYVEITDPAGEIDAEVALAETTAVADRSKGKELLSAAAKRYEKLGLASAASDARAKAAKLGAK